MRVRDWLGALAMLAIGALLSTAVGNYRRSTATAYRSELMWNDALCDFAVTWSGQYRSARPTPCRKDAMYYLEHFMPIILPDGRHLQPPKWKPGIDLPPTLKHHPAVMYMFCHRMPSGNLSRSSGSRC